MAGRTVLGYTGANIIEAAYVRLPVPRQSLGPDGLIVDPGLREQVTGVLRGVATYVRQSRTQRQGGGTGH